MPGRSIDKDDIPEVPETRPGIREGSEPDHKSLEFRAEVIPYDNCEDPNAPILAFSGDNMNIIFNIPKERFLKLAVAAIDHLGHDSDFKPPENTSNSTKESGNPKRNSNEISTPRLSDVVHSLDGDNTNRIVNAYEEDGNETLNSKNKDDILTVDIKSCVDYSNRPIELCGESQSGSDTEKPCLKIETNNFQKSANFQSTLADSEKLPIVEKYRESSEVMESSKGSNEQCESNGDLEKDSEKKMAKKDCENTEEKVKGSKSSNAEDAYVEQEQNSKDCETESEVDIPGEMNLSAHSLDISAEDCPELENAWPDVYPYEKTEEIPVTELKSLELKDVSTKYFKLELSNEFIVIKVTSGSGVLVDAAKYKELEKESNSKAGSSENISEKEPTQSFTNEVCRKSLPVDHKHADSVDEKVSQADKSANCESKDDRAVISKEATGTQITSELVDKSQYMKAVYLVPKNVKTVSKETIQTGTLSENSSDIDETVEAGTSKSFELVSKVEGFPPSNAASNIQKSSSADETFELGTPNKVLGNPELEKIITLKIEQKLEELDTNVPGVSPTERLRFTLTDSLKSLCGESEAKKQMEECVTTENLLKESDTKVSLLEKSNERISVSPEKCPKEISQDEFVTESSDSYRSNMMKLGHGNKSESLNVSLNAEKELGKSGSEHAFSAKSKLIGTSLDNSETGLSEDTPAVGKLISNDQNFQSKSFSNADISLEEINIENVSMNLSSEDKDSFEDSALGNDLHVSEAESLKNFSELENMECKETNSQKNLDNVPCKLKDNDVGATSISKHTDDLSNELSEQAAIKENGCRKESIVESTKLKVSGDLKCLAEKKTPQGTSVNGDSAETLENKLNTDIIVSGKNLENCEVVKEMDKLHEISEEEYTKPEKSELVREIPDVLQSPSVEKTPEDESKISEIVLSDDVKVVKNGKEETENITESIADANVEVVLNEPHSVEHATNESPHKHPTNKPLVEQNSECIDLVSETAFDTKGELPENSFTSNMDSFMDTTVDTNLESASEGGDIESDDKSIASESDDGKDSCKQASKRKGGLKGHIREADEVDCAPTRVRNKKAISGLSKDVIPENSEVKNSKASKYHDSYLNASGKTPLGGRSLRSKSLDPTPQTSKGGILHEKKYVAESEEMTRRARAKTPDIVSKKDLKSTARSSPRKFTRAASTEPSSTRVESTKTTVADDHSKSRANLDSSISTRRGKRGSKE